MSDKGRSFLKQVATSLPLVGELRGQLADIYGRLGALERRVPREDDNFHTIDRRFADLENLWREAEGRLPQLEERARASAAEATRRLEREALATVADFWKSSIPPAAADQAPILVELLLDNAEYLLRALVVAKLTQRVTGAPVIGLVGTPEIVGPLLPHTSPQENARLAKAFGIDRLAHLPGADAVDGDEPEARSAIERIAALAPDGQALPPPVIEELRAVRTRSGFPIGRVVQESFMRAERQPTVAAGAGLLRWTRRVLGFHVLAEELLASLRPSAFVTGHIDYCPWGHLADLVARGGGRVLWYRMECRLPIHMVGRLDPDTTVGGMMRKLDAEAFGDFEACIAADAQLRSGIDAKASARWAAVRAGLGRHFRWVDPVEDKSEVAFPLDYRRPTYCLFTHTFTDQPAADEGLFVDHLEWLTETCRHAAASRAYNLIVKVHPLDKLYDRSDAIDAIVDQYAGAANIHVTREQVALDQLARDCVLGITVRGTPGIKMTALGMPMVLAGRGAYSDAGFCLVPRTRAEYFELLERGPPFAIDSAEQARRARLFQAFDRHWSAPATPLVPGHGHRTSSDPQLWRLIGEGARVACLETDQALRALARAWPKGHAKVVAPEIGTVG